MNFSVKILDESIEHRYDEYLVLIPTSLFYACNKFRKLLKDFLNAKDVYFIAVDEQNTIMGVLPAFLKENSQHGNVLNSLPFYGSNGGVIEFENNEEVKLALVNAFNNYAINNNCVASTIVSSPLNLMENFYESTTEFNIKDSRIGQLTQLPESPDDVSETVMKLIDSKMRNLIRKAQKLEIEIIDDEKEEYLNFLIQTHQENMVAIGGIAKTELFFKLIPNYFNYGTDYKILVAKKDGQLIAALLLFYFNKTVEYYTPVIKAEFRNSQPMSLLIFEAMKESTEKGYKWWNWGGTWASQGGVYHFKSQWGTKDLPYYYYTKIIDDSILKRSKEQLLEGYPYFFVAPFSALIN